jgi:two-component system chemotaxis response regulator CheY
MSDKESGAMPKDVLVLSESAQVRAELRTSLSAGGFDVTESIDSNETMQLLTQNLFDITIVDLAMENSDCIELVRKIRSTPGLRFLPVVMLAGKGQEEKKLLSRKAGASGWISQPFVPEQLVVVTRMLCPTGKGRPYPPLRPVLSSTQSTLTT